MSEDHQCVSASWCLQLLAEYIYSQYMAQPGFEALLTLVADQGFSDITMLQFAELLRTNLGTVLEQQTQLCNAILLARAAETLAWTNPVPLNTALCDEELLQLQQEVFDAHATAVELRQTVPHQLQRDIHQCLQAGRPDILEREDTVTAGTTDEATGCGIPPLDIAALAGQLVESADSAPGLKAALANVIGKLRRNVAVAEAEAATLEPEIINGVRICPGSPVLAVDLGSALKSGAVGMRRHAARQFRSLNGTPRPVPQKCCPSTA